VNNTQSPAIKHALQQLGNELIALREFVALLNSEQQALLNNATDSLLNLSESKTLAANQLMEMGSRRRAALLGNSKDSMETWLAKHAPALQTQWNEIRKLAAQSQQLNSTNGELINSRMRNNQQALNVLYNSSKSAANLYGPDGQANINSAGRHLGSV
jgi:flagellar biosynthesis/type III secretory pathway chaperone